MIAQTSVYIPHTPTKNYNEKMFKETLEKVSQLKIGFSAEDVIEVLEMCYKTIIPIMVYASTIMVLLGLVAMYLAGEKSLTPDKKKSPPKEQKA